MSGAVNLKPLLRFRFVFTDLIAYLGMKNFGSTARHASQSYFSQVLEDLFDTLFSQELEPIDLDGRPGLQVQGRVSVIQILDDVPVPVVFLLVMQATDDMQFRATVVDGFLSPGDDLLVVHHVTLFAAQISTKCAKIATINAYIRRVEMGVNVVVTYIAVDSLPDDVGQLPDVIDRNVRLIKEHTVVER